MAAVRRRRKKNKLRGQRTMGAGNTKNRRGAGGRGGRGNAGANKHRFHSIGRLKEKHFRLVTFKERLETISLRDLDLKLNDLVAKGKVTMDGEKFVVDKKSGFGKVLSKGTTDKQIVLRINASKQAIKKILAAGGAFEFDKKDFDLEKAQMEVEEAEFEAEE
jgi:large subunit ribosomal protein L15